MSLAHGSGKRRRLESENGDQQPKDMVVGISFNADEDLPTAKLLNDEQI